MRISKNGLTILTVEDWIRYAPPKRGLLQWKDDCSAKEMARYWTEREFAMATGPIYQLLRESFGNLCFEEALAEQEIRIDHYRGEHRNCDLVVQAKSSRFGLVRIHIEAKANEEFGELVGSYYDKMSKNPTSNLPARVKNIVHHVFGTELTTEIRNLRYQLLHATFASCLDAEHSGAKAAVFLVQEFRSKSTNMKSFLRNSEDWKIFLQALPGMQGIRPENARIYGAVSLPGFSVPLFLGKWTTELA